MGDPRVLTRAQLLASGLSAYEVKRDLQVGALVPLARGVYLHRKDHDALDATGLHRVWARHIGSTLRSGTAVSHVSAAILHRADTWNVPLKHVHVSRPRGQGWRRTGAVHAHAVADLHKDVVCVDGVPVTSTARTIVDVGRTVPFDRAVAIGDSLLRRDPSAGSQLSHVLDAAAGLDGVARARYAVSFLDGRSESVGESLSRVRMAAYGIPRPALQHEVMTRDGRRYRLDFFWEEDGVAGEFDGLGKYSDRRDLVNEKFREDALRDLGLGVIRWNWAELDRFDVVVQRFARARSRQRSMVMSAEEFPDTHHH
ncbi:hypothetical protein ACFWCF_09390 [Rhodococcus sp. NPDC060090]|uniref:hypothetical protein n=1 Tax=Rhodococcus sp. NPDC060090 TaxID=3347056 RepID=UPI0036521036